MKKIFVYGAMLLVLASCFREEEVPSFVSENFVVPSILHASIEKENDPETKVFLNGDRRVRWNADDRISVFYANSGNCEYCFTGDDGDGDGDFEIANRKSSNRALSPERVYAVYPYSSENRITTSGVVTVTLPEEQIYQTGSFGRGANTMMSVSELGDDGSLTSELSFKNVGGYIYFRLYGVSGVKVNSITLTGNNNEPLAGEATVTMNSNGTPEIEWGSSTKKSIKLVCDPPVSIGNSSSDYTEFWMAVPPTEFTKGFTFTIRGGGNVTEKKVSAPVNLQRNHIVPIAAVEVPYTAANTYSIRSREKMTLKQKVGQMLMIQDLTISGGDYLFSINSTLKSNYKKYPCGGFILKADNVRDSTELKGYTASLHSLANYPLLSIDEEGGNVARIGLGGKGRKYTDKFGDICKTNAKRQAATVGATGNPANAYASGNYIGNYLRRFGLDVNLAPVADVNNNPDNPVIGIRSFGSEPDPVASMVEQYLHGLQDAGVEGCLKHFPGHGNTNCDSHTGYTPVYSTWDDLLSCELVPFRRGIDGGARMIMTAHISLPNVTGMETKKIPSTFSSFILQSVLRQMLGFDGVIITDSMGMDAVSYYVSPLLHNEEVLQVKAAILAIQAGADIILGPTSNLEKYEAVFDGIVAAVENETISESRINESVDRILALKRHILAERGQLK